MLYQGLDIRQLDMVNIDFLLHLSLCKYHVCM